MVDKPTRRKSGRDGRVGDGVFGWFRAISTRCCAGDPPGRYRACVMFMLCRLPERFRWVVEGENDVDGLHRSLSTDGAEIRFDG